MAPFYSILSILTTIKFCLSFPLLVGMVSAQLSSDFYATSCPNALSTIKSAVESAVSSEARMGASLLRLHFHDCIVNLSAPIWSWPVDLGRRDSTTASSAVVYSNIPNPTLDLSGLINAFSNKGFTASEMVALSGRSHKIGQATSGNFQTRIYNETNIDSLYVTLLKSNRPSTGGDSNLAPLDVTSPTSFDTAYYTNLINKKGLLHSDQQLFIGGSTDSIVTDYSNNVGALITDIANTMVKMGRLSLLTGTSGQIRKNCRKAN
ncbi:cationic peroxidase 1-like [Castanea sativa]|uniref:cationic peroxidase 1-like n=1 Tax=Castanea sativa TaxID=21020 RepID=UPI003F64CA98